MFSYLLESTLITVWSLQLVWSAGVQLSIKVIQKGCNPVQTQTWKYSKIIEKSDFQKHCSWVSLVQLEQGQFWAGGRNDLGGDTAWGGGWSLDAVIRPRPNLCPWPTRPQFGPHGELGSIPAVLYIIFKQQAQIWIVHRAGRCLVLSMPNLYWLQCRPTGLYFSRAG